MNQNGPQNLTETHSILSKKSKYLNYVQENKEVRNVLLQIKLKKRPQTIWIPLRPKQHFLMMSVFKNTKLFQFLVQHKFRQKYTYQKNLMYFG